LRGNFAGRKRDNGGWVAETLARFLAVKFIPPREVRRNVPEKSAGAASSKRRTGGQHSIQRKRAMSKHLNNIHCPRQGR